jgi:hypothetical protein
MHRGRLTPAREASTTDQTGGLVGHMAGLHKVDNRKIPDLRIHYYGAKRGMGRPHGRSSQYG